MKPIQNWLLLFSILPVFAFSQDKVGETRKGKAAWSEVYCIGGDAIDSVTLDVVSGLNEDMARLVVITGASDNEKDNLKRTFTAHLKKGSFKKMLQNGKIEIVLNSDKHPETAFGGETQFAALLELSKNDKGDFKGYAALDGSVYKLYCPRDPMKYFDSNRS